MDATYVYIGLGFVNWNGHWILILRDWCHIDDGKEKDFSNSWQFKIGFVIFVIPCLWTDLSFDKWNKMMSYSVKWFVQANAFHIDTFYKPDYNFYFLMNIGFSK